VQAADFVLDAAAGARMIKGYAPYALTDKLVPNRGLRSHGPAPLPRRALKPEIE